MGSVVETRQAQSLPMTYAIGYFSYSSYSSLNSYSYMWLQGVYIYTYIYTVYIHNAPENVKCLNLKLMASMDSWIATIKSFKHIRFHLTCTRVSLNSLYWEWSSHLLIRNPCNVLVIPYYWVDDTSPTNGPHISSNQSNCSKLLQDQCPRAPGCDFDQDNELTMSTRITIQRSIDQHGLRRKTPCSLEISRTT